MKKVHRMGAVGFLNFKLYTTSRHVHRQDLQGSNHQGVHQWNHDGSRVVQLHVAGGFWR